MTVPSIGAGIGVERLTTPFLFKAATSSSVKPTMRNRTRVASTAISAERMSFSAATSWFCACCHSFSGAALPSYRSLNRSTMRARSSWERALLRAAMAVTKSFCGCTTSGPSISNSASPRCTLSPTLAISRVIRPGNGASTAVLVSSL